MLTVGDASVWLPAVVALGIGVGLIAGMFGVGGGFLLIPLMHVLLGIPLPAAVGAGLCATIANALGALLRYRTMGHAEVRFDIMLLGGSVLGVDAGARLLGALSKLGSVTIAGVSTRALPLAVTTGYAVLFCAIAWLLWTRPAPTKEEPREAGPLGKLAIGPMTRLPAAGVGEVSGVVVGYIGLVNGLLAGFLGIGGGILLIPIMLYGFGFSIRKTAGTGIVVVLAVALWGTARHAMMGHVHLGLAVTLMIGSALAAQVGASLTRSLPDTLLRRSLAAVMLLTLGSLIVKLVGSSERPQIPSEVEACVREGGERPGTEQQVPAPLELAPGNQ